MNAPIAYTYEADAHCPPCAIARFGHEPGHNWPPEDARDREGNPVGAIWPWDEFHEPAESGRFTLSCGTCQGTITECDHGHAPESIECECESCMAAVESATLACRPFEAVQ